MDQSLQPHILSVMGHIQIKHWNLALSLIFKTLHKLSGKQKFSVLQDECDKESCFEC